MPHDEASKKLHDHKCPQWAGRDVTELSHGADLDREAAMHEFDGKLPRHEAENKAYSQYKTETHAKAAAHHLQGIKLAEAAGDNREAKKHGLMYQLHLKQLGHEPVGPVPKEVQQHLDAASGSDREKFYSFRPHRGDIFVLDGLGKKEKTMADNNETLTLQWDRHDDDSGGYHEHLDKSERVLYRTWEVPHGARPSQHVLVKNDGFKQTTLGYFGSRGEAMAKAEALTKEGQQLSMTPMGTPQTAKVEKADNAGLNAIKAAARGAGGGRTEESSGSASSSSGSGSGSSVSKGSKPWEESSSSSSSGSASSMSKGSISASGSTSSVDKAEESGISAVREAQSKGGYETSEGMGSSGSSYGKAEDSAGSKSASTSNSDVSTSVSHSGGETRVRATLKAEGQTSGEMPAFSMAEKCGKCGSTAANCKCGNLGKAELCKRCGKAENLCKCMGMSKAEGQASQQAVADAEHKAAYEAGKALLQKSLAEGLPQAHVFGTAKDGSAVGTNPADVRERLHNLYVAAKFALESGKK